MQKDHLYFVVRAWGYGERSALVEHGIIGNFDELGARLFHRGYPDHHGSATQPHYCGLDARYRTDEVLAFCQQDPARLIPITGSASQKAAPVIQSPVRGYPGVIRQAVAPNYWKDVLHHLIHADDETLWLIHSQATEDYIRQMASEHKIHDPKSGAWSWELVSKGGANHYWDCEYLQCVMARLAGVPMLPEPGVQQAAIERGQSESEPRVRDEGRSGWGSSYNRWR